jgi:hypothetical protein
MDLLPLYLSYRMAFPAPSHLPALVVAWKPPQRFLHYEALYRGVYEFLREPPDRSQLSRAVRYLRRLRACYHPTNTMQHHRILWTQAWLDALEDPEDSEAETVVGEDHDTR